RTAMCARWTQGLRHGTADPFWPVEATGTTPREGAAAQTTLGPRTRAALRAGREVLSASTRRVGHAPRGVRHPAGHRTAPGGVWLDDQHGLHRAAEPRHPPARGSGG